VAFFNNCKYFEFERADESFEAYGQLPSGRFLQVAYRKESHDTLFIITAYDIEDKEKIHMLEDKL